MSIGKIMYVWHSWFTFKKNINKKLYDVSKSKCIKRVILSYCVLTVIARVGRYYAEYGLW